MQNLEPDDQSIDAYEPRTGSANPVAQFFLSIFVKLDSIFLIRSTLVPSAIAMSGTTEGGVVKQFWTISALPSDTALRSPAQQCSTFRS